MHAQDHLVLALHALQINTDIEIQETLREHGQQLAGIEIAVVEVTLQSQQIIDYQQSEKIKNWLSPSDPLTNHEIARQHHEPETGKWILENVKHREWKAGLHDHLWLCGPTGSGKTILAFTIIEDIRGHNNKIPATICCMFYFTLSDGRKQTYIDLLRSTLYQLCREPIVRESLLKMTDHHNRSESTASILESALETSCGYYQQVFLILDALDEIPGDGDTRKTLLSSLLTITSKISNMKILATSRGLVDIKQSMLCLKATPITIPKEETSADIRKYITTQLTHDERLSKLDSATRKMILEAVYERADGMYDADLISTTDN